MNLKDSWAINSMYFLPIGSTSGRETAFTDSPTQQEYGSFYCTYGECFSMWSDVESRILMVYMILLNSPEIDAVSAAFYSTAGFRAKLDMVDSVVKNSKKTEDEDIKIWNEIYKNLSKKSKNRNKLAHNTVYFGKSSEQEIKKMFLADPRVPLKAARFYVHDLMQIRDSFEALAKDVFSFWLRFAPQ